VYECAACHRQESVTAGTVLHRTRTELTKWFLAAYLMGRDKRGVSAKFLQRELGVAYQTAWTMAHKLRHGLSEGPSRPLHGLLEADETFIGGRGDPTRPGRSTANPDKSLVVAAVEKVPHIGAENAADERQQGEGGEADAPRQRGVALKRRRVDQPSEPSHDCKWHDRRRNRCAPDQHRAEMFVLALPDGSALSDRDKHARNAEYPDQQGRADHQC
jgi:hypothetical protein